MEIVFVIVVYWLSCCVIGSVGVYIGICIGDYMSKTKANGSV